VSQIELLKEERRALLEDNDDLNGKLNELYFENEALRKEA
jgi:FtsZ-binding cell division protein ZapB